MSRNEETKITIYEFIFPAHSLGIDAYYSGLQFGLSTCINDGDVVVSTARTRLARAAGAAGRRTASCTAASAPRTTARPCSSGSTPELEPGTVRRAGRLQTGPRPPMTRLAPAAPRTPMAHSRTSTGRHRTPTAAAAPSTTSRTGPPRSPTCAGKSRRCPPLRWTLTSATGPASRTWRRPFVEFDLYAVDDADYLGVTDHSVAQAFAWTPAALYYATKVYDDTHQNGNSGWNGDSVQLMFTDAARSESGNNGAGPNNINEGIVTFNYGLHMSDADASGEAGHLGAPRVPPVRSGHVLHRHFHDPLV